MTLLIYTMLVIIAKALMPHINTTELYIIGVIVWFGHLLRKK